jgi:methionyl-tRNA synthetase
VIEFLKNPLNDLCISRPRERLAWGIPLPFDEDYVTYVWFDALVNYITAALGDSAERVKQWPADIHIIGKDILVPPHAVYWPIMLHAAGFADEELPKHLLVHGFWLVGGKKESKSEIEKAKAEGEKRFDPMDLIAQNGKYGPDAFRYFVMRDLALGEDSEITAEHFAARYNSELADDFGNLVARFLNMCSRYAGGCVPKVSDQLVEERQLFAEWETTVASRIADLAKNLAENPNALLSYDFSSMLSGINTFVKSLNRALETIAPWKLAKSNDEKDKAKLESCLAILAEGIRVVATAYTPVMPTVSAKVLQCLDQPPVQDWRVKLHWDQGYPLTGARLGDKVILFPKIESAEAKEKKKQAE